MDRLKIGQMAKLNNVSEQTLRLYDKIGILKPNIVDETNGYRYYDLKQCFVLDYIKYSKSLGMELSDIKENLSEDPTENIWGKLAARLEAIEKELAALKIQKEYVENAMISFGLYQHHPKIGEPVIEEYPDRFMVTLKTKRRIYNRQMLQEYDGVYDLEFQYAMAMRELHALMEKEGLPFQYACNEGVIDREYGIGKEELTTQEVFAFVNKTFTNMDIVEKYPGGEFLVIYLDDFAKEYEGGQRLIKEIKENKYEICGEYICEEISMLAFKNADVIPTFYRIMLPIKTKNDK